MKALQNVSGLVATLVIATVMMAYPPESEDQQARRADIIAWCDVVSIELLEAPRLEQGMSAQLREFTLRVTETVKGETPVNPDFKIRFAEYELLHTKDLKHIIQPEILVWEIHRRPRIEIGKQYKVYLRKNGERVEPLVGRWSVLQFRVDPKLYEKWTGVKEPGQAPGPAPTSVTSPAAQESRRP